MCFYAHLQFTSFERKSKRHINLINFAFIGAASHTEAFFVLAMLGNMETLIIICMDFMARSKFKIKKSLNYSADYDWKR